jgi:hypothetical protein
LKVEKAGELVVHFRPRDAKTWKAINLRAAKLTPVE